MLRTLPAIVLAALTACATSGGGGSGDGFGGPVPKDPVEASAEALASQEICQENVGPLLESLQELDSRLSVGLVFQEYSERVGDVRVAYDRLDINAIDRGCLRRVAVPLEKALNSYVEAYNTWNDCIGDLGCDIDGIDSQLQNEWADATVQISRAETALDGLAIP